MAIYRVAWEFTRPANDDVVWTAHYESVTDPDVNDVAVDLSNALSDFLLDDTIGPHTDATTDYLAEGMTFTRTTAQDVAAGPGSNVGATTDTVVSTAISSLPGQIAACITFRTPLNSRRGRGRLYFGPLAIGDVWNGNDNAWVSTFQATLDARWTAFMVSITGASANYQQVVWSRVGQIASPVTAVQVDGRPDTQRRRA